jgi:succinate dehydrogenase/fumarate reductase flavoprotein subunit
VGEDTIEETKASLRRWSELTADEIAAYRARSKKCFEEMFDFSRTSKRVLESLEQLARSTARYKPMVPAGSPDGL